MVIKLGLTIQYGDVINGILLIGICAAIYCITNYHHKLRRMPKKILATKRHHDLAAESHGYQGSFLSKYIIYIYMHGTMMFFNNMILECHTFRQSHII